MSRCLFFSLCGRAISKRETLKKPELGGRDLIVRVVRLIEGGVLCYAALSYGIFALAIFGRVSLPAVLGLLIVSVGIAVAVSRKIGAWGSGSALLFGSGETSSYDRKTLVAVTLASLVFYVHVLFIPPYIVDDLVYHLVAPQHMARSGGLYFSGLNLNSNFPMLFEFPLVLTEMLGMSANLANLGALVALISLFFEVGRKLTRIPVLVMAPASLLLATTPVIYDLVRSAYVELLLTLLVLLSLLQYLAFQESGNKRHWLWCCLWVGLACATRYTALYCAAVIFVWEFFRKRSLRDYYSGVLLAVITCLPWYLKNALMTGNPFFPMLDAFFSSPFLSDLRAVYYRSMLAGYNDGRELADYVLLPFKILAGWTTIPSPQRLGFGGQLSLFFSIALAGLGLRKHNRSPHRIPQHAVVSIMALGFVVIWMFYSQQVRFLLTFLILPLLYGLERFWSRGRGWRLGLALICIVVAGQNASNLATTMSRDRITQLLSGSISREQFLGHHLPQAYEFAKAVEGMVDRKTDRIFAVGIFGRSYYFGVPVESNTYYDAEPIDIAFDREKPDRESFERFLEAHHITHVLMNWSFYRSYQQHAGRVDLPNLEGFFASSFAEIARRQDLVLYRTKR